MKHSRIVRLAGAALITLTMAAGVQSSTSILQVESTFESGTLTGWKQIRTNLPVVTTERARSGKYSMKAVLRADAPTEHGKERNEMQSAPSNAPMNTDLWYGFSVFLPSDHVTDKVWELVAQWYPYGDNDEEWGRQPTLGLFTTNGRWSLGSKSSSQVTTPINHPSIKTNSFELGAQELNKWTDWVFNIRWTHESTGYIKVWKDGKVVLDYKGPTSYNDKNGPFVKLGIYKGWAKMPVDKARVRTVYHDDFRMAGPKGSYAAVAPGGGVRVAAPPKGLLID